MGTTASLSDPDVSSSEHSVDTVIYVPGSRHRHPHQSSAVHKMNTLGQRDYPSHQEEVVSRAINGSAHPSSPYTVAGELPFMTGSAFLQGYTFIIFPVILKLGNVTP